ncbi:hypothetical protein IWQ61_006627, partial [Dispira simplex]
MTEPSLLPRELRTFPSLPFSLYQSTAIQPRHFYQRLQLFIQPLTLEQVTHVLDQVGKAVTHSRVVPYDLSVEPGPKHYPSQESLCLTTESNWLNDHVRQNPQAWTTWLIQVLRRATQALTTNTLENTKVIGDSPEIPTASDVIDSAAQIIANLCGNTASGPIIRSFYLDPTTTLRLCEPAFAHVDLGYKTWGAALLMARWILCEPEVIARQTVLELGAGTGLVGFVCALRGATKVYLTDYQTNITDNLKENVRLNVKHPAVSAVCPHQLDWSWFDENDNQTDNSRLSRCTLADQALVQMADATVILGADIIYELTHARWLPRLLTRFVQYQMSSTHLPGSNHSVMVYVMVPCRPTHASELELWENQMKQFGWSKTLGQDFSNPGYDDAATTYQLQRWHWQTLS